MTSKALLPTSLPNVRLSNPRQWVLPLALVLLAHAYVVLRPSLRLQNGPEPALLPMVTRVIEVVPELPKPSSTTKPQKVAPKGRTKPQERTGGSPATLATPYLPPPVLAVEQSASPIHVASAALANPVNKNAAFESLAVSGKGGNGQGREKGQGADGAGKPTGKGEDKEKVVLTVPTQVKVPTSRDWSFATTFQDRKSGYYIADVPTTLKWKVQDGKYEVFLGAAGPHQLYNKLSRHSAGSVGDKGLVPDTFTTSTFSGAKTVTYFQAAEQQISFSKSGSVAKPLLPGSQDEISAAIQLAVMFAGEPTRYKVGDQVAVNVANRSDTQVWLFNIESDGTVDIPAGQVHAIKLTRSPRVLNDTGVTVWLSPEQQYMPVRLRLDYSADRYDDMKWRGF